LRASLLRWRMTARKIFVEGGAARSPRSEEARRKYRADAHQISSIAQHLTIVTHLCSDNARQHAAARRIMPKVTHTRR